MNPRPSDYKSDALPLSYASIAKTNKNYHRGNPIASRFLQLNLTFHRPSAPLQTFVYFTPSPWTRILPALFMRTRRSILIAVVLVAAAAALWLIRDSRRDLTGLPELISLAPIDPDTLIYLNLKALRHSELLQFLAGLAPAPDHDPEYAEFVRATGFEYERDLDRVLLLFPNPKADIETVAIADGSFNQEKIVSYALRTGRRVENNGKEFFVVPVETERRSISFSFLSRTRILLAEGDSLPTRNGSGLTAEMRVRVGRVAGSPVFAVGRLGPTPPERRPGQLERLLASIRWWSLAVRPEEDLLLVVVDAECETEGDARQLAGAADGLRVLGRSLLNEDLMKQQLPPESAILVEAILNRGQVKQQGNTVRLHFHLTREMLSTLGASEPPR